jgi:hypothetical protein
MQAVILWLFNESPRAAFGDHCRRRSKPRGERERIEAALAESRGRVARFAGITRFTTFTRFTSFRQFTTASPFQFPPCFQWDPVALGLLVYRGLPAHMTRRG